MSRKQGETWRCPACNAELIGARTREGNIAPITYNVQAKGNVLLFRSSIGIECRTFAPGEVLDALKRESVPLRLNHFADCPDAQRFEQAEREHAA